MRKHLLLALVGTSLLLSAQDNAQRVQPMTQKRNNYSSFTKDEANVTAAAKFNKTNLNHPELGLLPYNAQFPGYVEVLEKRTIDERYFVNANRPSEFRSQRGRGALHMKVNDQWVTIDPRLKEKGNGVYEAPQQYDPVGFDAKQKHAYIKTPQGVVTFNNWKLYGSQSDNVTLLAEANWSNYTAGDDGVYVTNIFPGIDAEMNVERGSVKTNFIVKKLNFASYTNLLFKDEYGSATPSLLKFKGDAAGSAKAVSEVALMSGDVSLVEMDEAVAYPKGGAKEDAYVAEYLLEGNKLVIPIPVSWIQKYIDHTDVIIDPLVTSTNTLAQGSITGSMYNGTCSWVNSCNYNLTVNTPANATLTDAIFSFAYTATGICFLSDGALQFTTGACTNPSGGLFWSCNTAGTGTCTANNYSMWTDVQSCMPAPSCSPVPVTFTLKFYRSCFGSTGCSNNCVAANSPLTITLQGHTVEFTNPGSEITVSSNNICFGQTITAATSAQYGVPAYSTNWSFNSSGTPSIATGISTSISFPSPGTYTLYSFVTDGCSQTTNASTVVTVNPIPTVTASASPNPICLGQSSTLTAGGATTYSWSANAGGGTGSTKNVTPGVGTTVYTVTGTASGCSNTATVSVTVNPNPTVTATANPTSICAGQTATLTPGGATTYTWSSNEGGTSNNPTTVTPGSTTTYTVTGTDNNGCNSSGQVTVTIIPPPSLTVTPASATVCAGSAATCTVTGATTYTWSANAGSVTTSTLSVSPTTTDTYTVTGNNGSCTSQATFVVNVNPLPTLTVSSTPANICNGDTATLSVSGANTYTWSSNAGGGSVTSLTVAPSSNTTYTVAGTLNGCSDSTTITVNVGVQPVVSVSASDSTICSGQTTTLTATGATNYTWLPNGSGTSTTVTPSSSTTYTLIGDNGGCSDTTFLLINVNPLPTVSAVASQTAICAGQSDTLTAGGGVTYSWSSNAGSATTSTVIVTPGATDTFTVTGTDNNGCSNMATVTATVNTLPTVAVNSSTICSGQQTATLTATGANTYSWSNTQTGTTITVTPTSNTNYTVVGTDANGCSNQAVANVTVNQPPTVSVNSSTICAGQQTATLTASGATVYTWTPTSGLTPPIGATVTANPGTTTTYTVTGVDLNGCIGTASTTVVVNQPPTVTASVTPGTICSGSSATLAAAGAVGYQWSANAGSSTTQSTNVTPSASDVYTVTGTDANGCVGSATVALTVNPTPTLQAVSNAAACAGTNVSANFNSGGATVNWTNSNTNIGLAASGSGSINYTAPNVTNTETGIIVATPVANGCTGASQTFTVTVYPKPTVTGGTPDTARCGMPTGSVTGVSVSGNGPFTYQWYSGGAAISGANTASLTTQPAGVYSLQVTNANGCTAGTSAITIPGTNSVTAAFVPSPTAGIAPLNVSFTNLSVGATSYNWNFGNGSTNSNQTPSTTYNTGGTYVVTLTASSGGCSDTYTATIIVDQAISLVVPNVFTPNGDGINDEFGFIASGITTLTCDIYNRWGQKIKTLSSPTDKWDGKLDNGHLASEGTYFYVVVATSFDSKPHNSQGSLTILK